MAPVSDKTVGRLSMYRRLLSSLLAQGVQNVYSHQLANMGGVTAAQVRRDLMSVGYTGSPTRGYDVRELNDSIAKFMDAPQGQGIALIGVGNLGRAVLAYFAGRHPNISFVAAFDSDPAKAERVIHGCRCYPMGELATVVEREQIRTAVIAVPAEQAQGVAEQLVASGIASILNFAPASLRVGPSVYVEHNDLTTSIERVAFFARVRAKSKELAQ